MNTKLQSQNWHAQSVEKTFTSLETSKNGLSNEEALTRLAKYGKNRLPEPKRRSLLMRFIVN